MAAVDAEPTPVEPECRIFFEFLKSSNVLTGRSLRTQSTSGRLPMAGSPSQRYFRGSNLTLGSRFTAWSSVPALNTAMVRPLPGCMA